MSYRIAGLTISNITCLLESPCTGEETGLRDLFRIGGWGQGWAKDPRLLVHILGTLPLLLHSPPFPLKKAVVFFKLR